MKLLGTTLFSTRFISQAVMGMIIFLLTACATQKPELRVSPFYRFTFEGQEYRIRSIKGPDEDTSFNEMLGARFRTVDYNQDQFLDRVEQGDISLERAQAIYAYGLETLRRENKLKVQTEKDYQFKYEASGFMCEIATVKTQNGSLFNQVRITLNPNIVADQTILIDYNADGEIDKILKGKMSLEEAQKKYEKAIEYGLKKERLVKDDGTIHTQTPKV